MEIISSLSNLAGQVYCNTIDISITLEMVWERCVRWGRFRGSLSGARVWLVSPVRRTEHTREAQATR